MDKILNIDGVRINYEELGDISADPVIVMHGWGCNHKTIDFVSKIASENKRVYNIDLPGHGNSSEPDQVWGVEDFARLIEKFIEIEEIKKPSLIGHSFGGRISIVLASRNDVDKVVLIDSAGIKPKRSLNYYRKVYTFKFIKNLVKLVFGNKKGEEIVERIRSKKGSPDYRNSSPMMRKIMSRCVNEDLRKYMPLIKAPTLLIWGENDTATPLGDAKIMEKLIPDSGLVSFAGCGHYSFLDNPGGFKAVLREFFK